MIADDELARLLKDTESDRVERKSSLGDTDRIRQAICAFANDMPDHRKPGVLFVGADDEGNNANLLITDELIRNLASMRSDGNILPFPMMTVQKRVLAGFAVAVVEVEPSQSPPVRFDGRIWIRVGSRRAIATADEERRLVERHRAGMLPFDHRPVHSSQITDIDLDLFHRVYLPSAVPSDILRANERSVDLQLASLHFLASGGSPNVAGILVLGKAPRSWFPGAYVQFTRFEGTELTDPIRHQKEIDGPLPEVLRTVDEVLDANVSVAADVKSKSTEQRRADYPIVALQQLVRNAILHRNYETSNAPVRVYWFLDRIEIHSPGGPYGQVNLENYGHPGVTDYRNPLLAEAMKCLGYVQRFGIGLPLARSELSKNGNPELKNDPEPNAVLVTVRRAQ